MKSGTGQTLRNAAVAFAGRFPPVRAAVAKTLAELDTRPQMEMMSWRKAKLVVLVKTRVSQINGCAYCLHMHTEHALKLGESDTRLHLLDAWQESNLYSARERAALAWAEPLTNIAATHAPDGVYADARCQFSEKELADLSMAVAMINAWNRLCIGLRSVHPADLANAA